MLNSIINHNGLLFSAYFNDEGDCLPLPFGDDDILPISSTQTVWLHMCAITQDTRAFLENETKLDEIVVRALLAEETRPRTLIRKDGILLILRAMNLNPGCDPEDMISLRLWIDDNHIISTRLRDTKSIEDMKQSVNEGQPPKRVGAFLTMITDRVYGRMEPFIESQEDETARLEEHLAKRELSEVNESAAPLRIKNAIYRRYIIPQKAAIEGLLKSNAKWLREEDLEQLVESLDRITRYIETLNDVRDRMAIINDELTRQHDANLSATTYIFTLAATIFLPLSFLTGLFGVNVGGLPGIESELAFAVFVGICVVVAAIQIWIFRFKGWF